MSLPRMFPWVSIGVALAACEGASPPPTTPPPAPTAPAHTPPAVDPPPPVKAEVPPAQPGTEQPPSAAELTADVRNANAFTLRVLAKTRKPTENAMVSGTSVRHALGSTYLGAHGTTAKEMATALALESDAKLAMRLARAELAAWRDARGDAELHIASRLWIDQGFPLKANVANDVESGLASGPRRGARGADLIEQTESAFSARAATVDFARKSEDARTTINAWVSERTKDKIKELLPQGSVDPRTKLVVTNAIWFKGAWEFPFPKSATKDEPFKLDARKNVAVPTMHLTDSFRFAAQGGAKILELRYAKSQLAMVLVLPDDASPDAFAKLEAGLGADVVERWTAALATARVNVTLPRFTFRSGGPMSTALQDLGMKTAFTDKADFGGIADPRGAERLSLSQVFHQTWLAVDEVGTEAAAATGGVMRTTSLDTGPIAEFKADRPFLFILRDTKHGRLLFAGRVADPRST